MYFYFQINPSTPNTYTLTFNLQIYFNAFFPHNTCDTKTPLPADIANLKCKRSFD